MSYVIFVDVLFVLLFLTFVAFGIKRGFLSCFFHSAGLLLSAISAFAFGDMVSNALERAFFSRWAYEGVYGTVERIMTENGGASEADVFLSHFPDFLIAESLKDRVAELFSAQTGERLTRMLAELLSKPVSAILSHLFGYGVVFLASFFILRLFAFGGTALAEKIAPFRILNRFLGGVWGAIEGAICLLGIAFFVKLLFRNSVIYTDSVIARAFCDSAFLSFLNFD